MKNICFIAIFCISTTVMAQDVNHFLQLGLTGNAYKGDLQDSYDNWGSAFHVGLKFNKKKRLNGAFLLSIGNITGQNLDPEFQNIENPSIQPNKFFQSSIITGQYNLQVNLINNKQWRVFLSQGVGLIRYNPKDEFGNTLLDMNNTRGTNEDYNNMSFMFPTQAGVTYFLKNNYGFGLQAGFLNILTDYIDNISDLGSKSGNDNISIIRFSLMVPLILKEKKELP